MPGKMTMKDVKNKVNRQNDSLDLSLCDLEEVPVREIASVKGYSHLDLSNNALTTLPKSFATLTHIVKLDLSKNMLTDLPENFGELKLLRYLDLYCNKISRLPLSLGELRNLKWLDLKDNPLTPAVASIAGPCSNASECQACAKNIVNYLSLAKMSIDEEKQRRLNVVQENEKIVTANKKETKEKKKNEKKAANKDKLTNLKKKQEKINMQKASKAKQINKPSNKVNELNDGVSVLQAISLILTSTLVLLVIVSILLSLLYNNKERSQELFKILQSRTGLPMEYYHHEGRRLIDILIENSKLWTNHARDFLLKTYDQYFSK